MNRSMCAVITLIALAAPTVCLATPPRPGPYISGFAGVAIPNNTNASSNTPLRTPSLDDRIQFDPSVDVGATAGYDFGIMRMEAEVSYKNAEIKSLVDRVDGSFYGDIDGRVGALALMGNLFVDLRNPGPITPYFGGGVGFASLNLSDTTGTNFTSGTRGVHLYSSDSDAVFAYQVGGGVEVAMNRVLSLDLGYRYFHTSTATFNADTPEETRLNFESHNVTVGLRVKFR